MLSRSLAKFGYVVKKDSQTETKMGSGTIKANNQLILDGKVIGTITGDALNGSFMDNNDRTITLTERRTL